MNIIDKYIIKKFLTTFFFMLGIVMLFSTVFDISSRLSEFIDNNATISGIIFKYYANFVVYYGNTFSALIIFLSVIWFTAKMAQDSEIIPLMFSGKPFTRILRPYFVAATILVILSLFLNHFVIPRSNKIRLDFEEQYYRDRMFVENYHAQFPGNMIVYFSSYLSDENIVNDLKIEIWSNDGKPSQFIYAKTAMNTIGTQKWKLNNYYVRKIGKPHDDLKFGAALDTILNFTIEEMAMRDNRAETMTFTELKKFIEMEKRKGSPKIPDYQIMLYQRTSLPFATYVLTLMGVAVSSRKKRGGIGINIAIGLLFVFIYIFTMQVSTVAAKNLGFPPIIAVWVPNFIFGILGFTMYRLAPK
jgi:lipopolysaccharide export system permease protein